MRDGQGSHLHDMCRGGSDERKMPGSGVLSASLPPREPLIRLNGVSFAYEGQTAVRDLNFEICPGDYLVIVGENGSGKTTLLKGLLGLKEPVSGVLKRSEHMSVRVGYMPQQQPFQRDFPATCWEVVLSGRLSHHGFFAFYSAEDRRIAHNAMASLSIETFRRRSFRDLSGGERQRVLLARALAAADGLLLLDEPTTGIDPIVSHAFYRLVEKLNRERNMTIIMVSHDIHCVMHDATHVLHLGHTQLFFGDRTAYLNSMVATQYLSHGGDIVRHQSSCRGGVSADGDLTCGCGGCVLSSADRETRQDQPAGGVRETQARKRVPAEFAGVREAGGVPEEESGTEEHPEGGCSADAQKEGCAPAGSPGAVRPGDVSTETVMTEEQERKR